MKFDKVEYTVSEMMGPPQTLLIDSDGGARYESHSDVGTLDDPEIGLYQDRLPSAEIEGLSRLLEPLTLQSLPDHWGRVAAGDRYKRIRVTAGRDSIEKMVGTAEPVDPRLGRVISKLDDVAAEIRRHPRQNLRMHLSEVAIDASGALSADVAFSNAGTEAIYWVKPVSLPDESASTLSVRAWADKPTSQLHADEVFDVGVRAVAELRGPGAAQVAIPVAAISPDRATSFRISATLPVRTSGTYVVQVVYRNTIGQLAGRSVIVGELFSRPVKVTIRLME